MNKILMGIGAAIAVQSSTMAASVYDEAKVWFRGGYDANGDGVFAANEFVDSARPKSDTAHQTVTITGSGAAYGHGSVWSSFNPFYTNTQYYVSFPNGDCAASGDCSYIRIANPLASGESWSQYSIFIRFRWDGNFAPGNNNMLYVLDTGLNWNGKRGIWFGFKYFPETDDFAPFCYAGQANDVPSATKGIKIPIGEWQDIMITVYDRGVGSYASINLYKGSAGIVTNPGGLWPGLSDADSGKTKRVRLESSDVIKIGYTAFSGDIAEWALWPKVLSFDEMREVFGAIRPGDALFRIGKEDGKSDEFAASGREQYTIDANGTWDVVPSALNQTHDTLTINFDVHANWDYLNQILRLVAVSGSGWIEGTVTDPVRNKSITFKSRKLAPGHPADFFVPHDYLMKGPHTLALKLISGSGVTFDVLEMRGSFCLGQIDYNKSKNVQFEGTAKNNGTTVYPYDVVSGYWRAMNGGVANNTFSTTGTWEGNSGASTETTFFFDVPEDLVGCSNIFHISYNNFAARIDAPDAIRGYFNDTCFYDSSTTADGKEWDWEVALTNVPPNTLTPGRNTFRLRRTYTGSGTWWGGTRGFRLEIQNAPPRDQVGMIIVVK